MKKYLILLAAMSVLLPLSSQETSVIYLSGTDKDHTKDWQFFCTDGARAGSWTTIPVPSCWEQQGFGAYNYGHDRDPHHEQGLYRTTFESPKEWKTQSVWLVFEGVMTDAEVKVNGILAGPIHQGAFYRFKYDISPLLNFGGTNTLEVTVSKESSNRSVNEAERRADYWIFGGIFRPVYLEVQPKTFINNVAIDARHDGRFRANVRIRNLENKKIKGNKKSSLSIDVVLEDLEGNVAARLPQKEVVCDSIVSLELQANAPKAWTSETPNLYVARFTLWDGKKPLHVYRQRFGFRTIEFRQRDGFYVNDVKVKFKGVCRHTFWPESGRTSSKDLAIEDVNLIKDMNMNAVRMSHYPPDTYFLDVCDSLGLYVIDELAGWQSAYDSTMACRLVPVMIERDVNHPSIVIWSNGNEGGFPRAARPLYALCDIQKRQVVEPWSNYDGVDTHHYPKYGPTAEKASRGNVVYMPTESLHGLHDGGHGAGLYDYWEVLRREPTAAGQFLWNLADEGVVRHDLRDSIDVFNDKAPDGILGPHHEKEGSFYAIREVWSPVFVAKPDFSSFDGTLVVSNRYHFTNLNTCTFLARLLRYEHPMKAEKPKEVTMAAAAPDLAPWTEGGKMRLPLPADWKTYDVLSLTAKDAEGKEIMTWTWPISTPADLTERVLREQTKSEKNRLRLTEGKKAADAQVEESKDVLSVRTSDVDVSFDKRTGRISSLKLGEKTIPLTNGPRFVGINPQFKQLLHKASSEGYQVEAVYEEGAQITFTISRDGLIRLDYSYKLNGDFDFAGITFDYPEELVEGADLLADGPYHVWKNRMRGVNFALHQKEYNNTITGQTWDYPEFKGYYSHFAGIQLKARGEASFRVLSATEDLFLHLFTPQKPIHMSKNVDPPFPDGQISLLNCIPAIGTKFSRASEEGPEGSKAHFADQTIKGRIYLMRN